MVSQFFGISILIVLVIKVNTQMRETRYVKSYFEKSAFSFTSFQSTTLSNIKTLFQCAEVCSSENLCTRYEYCPKGSPKKCTLYQSGSTCHEEDTEKTNTGCKCFRMEWMRYENETCRCPVGYYGNGDQCCQLIVEDCTEGYDILDTLRGRGRFITSIRPSPGLGEPFEVLCNFKWGGFTIIQLRENLYQFPGFDKNWIEYRNGFGTLHGNFWLGLEKIYHILQNNNTNGFFLHIHLFDKFNLQCSLHVDIFNLEDESFNYTGIFKDTKLFEGDDWCDGMFTNLPPDSRPFSTFDHISYPNNFNCTGREESGWWFADDVHCSFSNLNSKRIDGDIVINTAKGTAVARRVVMQVKRKMA